MRLIAAALSGGLCAACGATPPPPDAPTASATGSEPRADFSYEDAEGGDPLTDERVRGRATVLVFLATYDLLSQAEAKFVSVAVARRRNRAQAAAVLLDPPENRALASAFRDSLHLDYPVAIGDRETIAGRGPFGDVHAVPTLVVLDAEGRVRWRHVGLAKDGEIGQALDRAR